MIELQGRYGLCYVNPNEVIAVSSYEIITGPNSEGFYREEFKGSKVHLKGGGDFEIKEEAAAATYMIHQS